MNKVSLSNALLYTIILSFSPFVFIVNHLNVQKASFVIEDELSYVTGQFRIVNIGTGEYLTQSTEFSGSNVEALPLDNNLLSQRWTLIDAPNGFSWFSSNWNNHYINSPGETNGTSTVVYDFNANWWSMMWEMEPTGGNIYRIKNRWAQRYLDVTTDLDVVVNNLDLNDSNQLWELIAINADCPNSYVVDYPILSGDSESINAANNITANNEVRSGATLNLRAGNEIILDSGFDAMLGSEFSAYIQDCNPIDSSYLSNPNSNATTNQIYNYLRNFKDDPNQCIILGQNLGWSYEMYNETVVDLETQTGEWLGLIGGQMRYTSTEIDYDALVTLYTNWQANGGICELGMLPDNPWTGNSIWDRSVTDIWQLSTPGEPGYNSWRTQLDFYADVLQDMEDAGVTILFRPLMEMNGDWFWYGYVDGQNNQQDYIDLYRDLYDYFTNVKGLDNLIWVYSANMAYAGIPDVDFYYPGDDVVDITGLDVYEDNLPLPAAQYQTMINLGKPFAFTEFGPNHNNMDGTHNYESYLNTILSNYPETIYAHAWHDWPDHLVAWISNQNATEALNIPCVVSRDEIAY